MDNSYCVVTFHTTNHAFVFEKYFKENGIEVKLMPIPRQFSSSCGLAARIPCELRERVIDICYKHFIEINEVHKVEKDKDKLINKKNSFLSKIFK